MASHRIVIEYKPIHPVSPESVAQICNVFYPNTAAADLEVFEDTYYDTNVDGFGEIGSLEQFMAQMVAHPGLNIYLRKAIRDGQYEFTTQDEKMYLFLEECAPALAPQGIIFTFA